MDYIETSKNNRQGIKSFKDMSSIRKRRCRNYQIYFHGEISRAHYDIKVYIIGIPCINYRYTYQ